MSEQLTIPASSIRGKDWTKLSLDTLENGPNPAQEPRLKKNAGKFPNEMQNASKGQF